jgi:hypothetical protein
MIARYATRNAEHPGPQRRTTLELRELGLDHHEHVLYGIVDGSVGNAVATEGPPHEIEVLLVERNQIGQPWIQPRISERHGAVRRVFS